MAAGQKGTATERSRSDGPGPGRRGAGSEGSGKEGPGPGDEGPGKEGPGPGSEGLDLESVATELYGLAPSAFTFVRDERAKAARQAGDRGLAAAIKGLRRPSVGAWLANLLVRQRTEQVRSLFELGAQLRQAQAELSADQMRRLSAERRKAVQALAREAVGLAEAAGEPAGEVALRELESTLEAALADADAADALSTGRMVKSSSYTGLGTVDLERAAGLKPAVPSEQGDRVAGDRAAGDRAAGDRAAGDRAASGAPGGEGSEAEASRAAFERAVADGARRLQEAERGLGQAQERQIRAQKAMDRAEADRARAQRAWDEAAEELTAARQELSGAERLLSEATAALDALGGPPGRMASRSGTKGHT